MKSWHWISAIVIVLLLASWLFYWFQMRPSKATQECSADWVEYSSDPGGQSARHKELAKKYGFFADGSMYIKNCLASKGIK